MSTLTLVSNLILILRLVRAVVRRRFVKIPLFFHGDIRVTVLVNILLFGIIPVVVERPRFTLVPVKNLILVFLFSITFIGGRFVVQGVTRIGIIGYFKVFGFHKRVFMVLQNFILICFRRTSIQRTQPRR